MIVNISAEETKKLIRENKDIVLIDVRTVPEFRLGHIENAQNINVLSFFFGKKAKKLNRKKRTIIYCLSGHRSAIAAKKMEKMGFTKLYNLEKGYSNWKD